MAAEQMHLHVLHHRPMVFGSALTLATFVLVVVFARFISWD